MIVAPNIGPSLAGIPDEAFTQEAVGARSMEYMNQAGQQMPMRPLPYQPMAFPAQAIPDTGEMSPGGPRPVPYQPTAYPDQQVPDGWVPYEGDGNFNPMGAIDPKWAALDLVFGTIDSQEKCFLSYIQRTNTVTIYNRPPDGCMDVWEWVRANSPLKVSDTVEKFVWWKYLNVPLEQVHLQIVKDCQCKGTSAPPLTARQAVAQPAATTRAVTTPQPKEESNMVWWVVGGGAAVVTVGGLIWFFTRKKKAA